MSGSKRALTFIVAGLGLVCLALGAAPASAGGPPSGVHFFGMVSNYPRASSQMPENSTTNLSFYGGPVMLTSVTYAIYWAPSGHSIDAGYQSLINRYFADVGGSSIYAIMTQYHDNAANPIKNKSSFGGAWVDTTAYPVSGNASNPLRDTDIQASVARAMAANGWTGGSNHMFFVFTAPGIESCYDSQDCTPGTSHPVYCAYHSFFPSGGKTVIYANMPYAETWTTMCRDFSTSPNGNLAADSTISITSHEHFEAITDIKPTNATLAWYDKNCSGNTYCGEIGDKCAYNYGDVLSDGSNITMHGNKYILQREWSNKAFSGASYSGCALSLKAHAFVDAAFTASDKFGTSKTQFHRKDPIFYFGTVRNDGSSKCTASGTWLAKGGTTTIASFTGTLSVARGVTHYYLKSKIPANAPLKTYTLTVSTVCNGKKSKASTTFDVVASNLSNPSQPGTLDGVELK